MGYEKVFWEYGANAKSSSVKVYSPALSAANFDAQEALRAAFETAVDAVGIGTAGSEKFLATESTVAKTPSANPLAQREVKWLVSMVESGTGNPVTFTVPCADLSLLSADGENMDATAPEYAALVAAVEAFVRSNDGNTVTVTSIKFRARSS